MGFELLYKGSGKYSGKKTQNENAVLCKNGALIISEKFRDTLNLKTEPFYLIYVDKKLRKIGIKFTRENDSKACRKVTIQKNSSSINLHLSAALKKLGVCELKMKESFKPFMINDLIVIDVKHLINESEG
jgi:hypothetical protein